MDLKYKTVDLFAGIGGIRRGFEIAGGFENVISAENDEYACITYQHLFGENPYNDVTSEEFKKKIADISYDVLLAGFPCQTFSRAGKQEGFLDQTRGTLFFDIADILNKTRPRAFLLENVDNLISHNKGRTFRIIIETLAKDLEYYVVGVGEGSEGKIEYQASAFIRNSKDFGVPQNRPRVYMVGFDKRRYSKKLSRLHREELPRKRSKKPIYKDLDELLEYQASPEYYLGQGYLETLKKHRLRHEMKGNGFGYIVVNEGNRTPIANAILATGGSGKERNLIRDPQEGVKGLCIKSKRTPLNNEGIRFMTEREWAKLQGFLNYAFLDKDGTEKFSFPVTVKKGQRYKQLGNSVSIPVIEEIAKFMLKILKDLDS